MHKNAMVFLLSTNQCQIFVLTKHYTCLVLFKHGCQNGIPNNCQILPNNTAHTMYSLCDLHTRFGREQMVPVWWETGVAQARPISHKACRFTCQRFFHALEPEEGLCATRPQCLSCSAGSQAKSSRADLRFHATTTLAKISAAFTLK